jgi:molybdopterin-dependent oxidoreductase alpha subunit
MSEVVGGGAKKVLYTLNTVRRIGLRNSTKALKAKNTCKACGLGMGGQLGGMTNEKNEFPSVCNKSIQAQSTDIQPAIPAEVFEHTISELKQLPAKELEHMGRLNLPLYKAKNSQHLTPISWETALELAANKLRESSPEKSFFYSSGRSSNEAGFVMQLFARLYGTNNINNCSYYCHQATGVGLNSTIGTGTSTVELEDLAQCDLIFLIGANPASNHPRLVHQLKNIRERGGDVVVINPAKEPGLVRFAVPKSPKSMLIGGNYIASYYLQPSIASDLWVFKGIAKVILEQHDEDLHFIKQFTDGFESFKADVINTKWSDICHSTGLSQNEIESVASTYAKAKNVVFAWGMGITHHLTGSKNVEYIANLALLRGMIGKKYSGLLPLRGHSNIQGVGTIGVKPVLAEEVINALEDKLNIKLPSTKGMDTMACLDAADQGEIDNAFIMGGNLFQATPDSKWAEQALDKIKCKIFLTTTLNKGHLHGNDNSESLILPVTARDEESQPTTQESMFNFVRLSDGGINRLENLKSESSVISAIATKVVSKTIFDFSAFSSHQSIRQAIAKCIPGMEDLKDIDVAKKEFHVRNRIMHSPDFKTKNKRAQFITHTTKVAHLNLDKPFKLMTIRSEGQFNSIIYEEGDSYRSVTDRWTILMNQSDLDALGLKEGSRVDVRSETGEMKSLSTHAFDLPPGNVMTYYPEANILVGRELDPRSKTPSFKFVEVSIGASSSK